jgi:tRNA nucleotidyltransferase (CCA-adding enzyme)
MDYKLPLEVKNILEKFSKAGYQIYIVGGAVRDLLMDREVHDYDFTTDANPEEILKLFPEGFNDNKFGTVGIPTDGQVYEVTTMRKEGNYADHRHPVEVGWTNKLEEDLARRDFTINSIAMAKDGSLVDPYNGQQDIKDGLIRAVGEPEKRFQEDALRLMRAVRIATQLNFDIEKETFQAIQKNAVLIEEVANERIRDELFKLLGSVNPYIGIIKLREAGILQIILPELERNFGIVQEGPKHDRVYDIGEHSLLSLKHAPSSDPLVRLAALLHDVGKADTFKTDSTGNVTFYNHDVVGGAIVRKIAKRFNISKKQTDKLYNLVRWHLFTVDENQTDSAIRRFIKNVGVENIEDMMAVRVGDRLGGGTAKAVSWRMEKYSERIKEVLKKPFSISDLKINGADVMGELNIKPGPRVGQILSTLFEEVLEDSSKNTKEYLFERVKQLD